MPPKKKVYDRTCIHLCVCLYGSIYRADCRKCCVRWWKCWVIQAEEDDGRIHQHASHSSDVGKFVARQLYRSAREEKLIVLDFNLWCVESRKCKTFISHLSFRKCKLNVKNIIDRIIPTEANEVMVKNANFEMVEKRSLKIRLAMGTTLFCHLIVMQLGQVKSKSSVSGKYKATGCSWANWIW